MRAPLAESLRAGRLPEWWDGVELGINVAGIPSYQSFYVPAWPVAICGPVYGTDLVIILHLLVGAFGVAAWASRLGASRLGATVGGALFMLSGYMSSMTVMHTAAMAPAWIPWIAWTADRLAACATRSNWKGLLGPAAGGAIFMSLAIMAGDPSAAISGALVGLLVAGARSERPLPAIAAEVGAIAMGAILSAAVLLPAALNLPETDRSASLDSNDALAWSLHPLSLLQVLWPHALGDPAHPSRNLARAVADTARGTGRDPAWAYSIYFGWVAIGMAARGAFAKARGVRILGAASIVILLLALGAFTPVYGWFRTVFFPEQWLRYPARHFAAVVVLWSSLAAIGFDAALLHARSRHMVVIFAVSLCIAVAVEAFVYSHGLDATGPRYLLDPPLEAPGLAHEIEKGGWLTIAALVGFGAALFSVRHSRLSSIAAPLAAAAVMVPIAIEAYTLIPRVSRDTVVTDAGVLSTVAPASRRDAPRPRVWREPIYSIAADASPEPEVLAAAMGKTAVDDLGILHGFAYLRGYSPVLTERRFNAVFKGAERHKQLRRIMELFSTEYAVIPIALKPPPGFELVFNDEADFVSLVRLVSTRQRAFVAGRWAHFANDDAVLDSMLAPGGDLELIRFVGDGSSDSSVSTAGAGIGGPCEVHTSRPERVDIHCQSPAGGYAVLVDSWSPGWSATVDGAPAVIERADMLLRAVRVGPGVHDVAFEYRTPGLRIGAWISLIGWLMAGLIVVAAVAGVLPSRDGSGESIPASTMSVAASQHGKGRSSRAGMHPKGTKRTRHRPGD
jgi:hypothetical protein